MVEQSETENIIGLVMERNPACHLWLLSFAIMGTGIAALFFVASLLALNFIFGFCALVATAVGLATIGEIADRMDWD